MSSLLPHVELETQPNPTASVIWLHGLGANGHDFEPVVQQLDLPSNKGIRFIFPHAPEMPVTINNGISMPAWYDIVELNIDRKVDEVQLKQSVAWINAFIANEIVRGIVPERIIIAGFSQGGAVAFEAALSHPTKLGGLLALSTYFATKDSIEYHAANQSLPIAIHHGTADDIVPFHLAQASSQLLTDKGYSVTFKSYPMPHSVCPQQVQDIRQWFIEVLQLCEI